MVYNSKYSKLSNLRFLESIKLHGERQLMLKFYADLYGINTHRICYTHTCVTVLPTVRAKAGLSCYLDVQHL